VTAWCQARHFFAVRKCLETHIGNRSVASQNAKGVFIQLNGPETIKSSNARIYIYHLKFLTDSISFPLVCTTPLHDHRTTQQIEEFSLN